LSSGNRLLRDDDLRRRTGHRSRCLVALEMQTTVARMNVLRETMRLRALELRVGLHSGPVISGVVDKHKLTFDVWETR
jgi:class 3 adenylate cyclase